MDSIIPTLLQGLDGNAKQSAQVAILLVHCACKASAVTKLTWQSGSLEMDI